MSLMIALSLGDLSKRNKKRQENRTHFWRKTLGNFSTIRSIIWIQGIEFSSDLSGLESFSRIDVSKLIWILRRLVGLLSPPSSSSDLASPFALEFLSTRSCVTLRGTNWVTLTSFSSNGGCPKKICLKKENFKFLNKAANLTVSWGHSYIMVMAPWNAA